MSTGFYEQPELLDLFRTYTASATSIGSHLTAAAERENAGRPLLVGTASDLALFPGGGAAPTVEAFRLSTRGFKELAAISHLGPAVASLAWMKEREPQGGWREDAERLLRSARAVRRSSSADVWRERIGVRAYAGREPAIAAMIDWACVLTERVLTRALGDGRYLTAAAVRRDYLEGPSEELPVSMNRIMVATFFLTGMDLAHRLITWFDREDLPWEQAMVIIAGRQGRPTAGVTEDSNSVAGVVRAASRGRLPVRSLLIAPHAPVFAMFDGSNLDEVAALEPDYRRMWSAIKATCDLGGQMFAGYPRFEPVTRHRVSLDRDARSVSGLPTVSGPTDWYALTTRLRVVLEDPRQLLSGAVTDFASQQLVEHGNDPMRLTVPGLDGESYPAMAGRDEARNSVPAAR